MANATKYIKKLSSAQPDAIATVLRANPLTPEMVTKLKELSEAVTKAPKAGDERRTPENDFLTIVVPLLENMMEEHAVNPTDVVLKPSYFQYGDIYGMNLEALAGHHGLLMKEECSLKTRMLFLRYQRGLIYMRAHELISDFVKLKNWLFDQFSITYTTATAYMSVASLITQFPLLLKSGLTYDQMRRHLTRIRTYCDNSSMSFSEACTVTDGANEATIEANPCVVHVKDHASRDADFEYVVINDEREEQFACFENLTNPPPPPDA